MFIWKLCMVEIFKIVRFTERLASSRFEWIDRRSNFGVCSD